MAIFPTYRDFQIAKPPSPFPPLEMGLGKILRSDVYLYLYLISKFAKPPLTLRGRVRLITVDLRDARRTLPQSERDLSSSTLYTSLYRDLEKFRVFFFSIRPV